METAGKLRVVMEAATVLMVAVVALDLLVAGADLLVVEADLLVVAGADLLVAAGLRAEDLQAVTKHYFISEKIRPLMRLCMN